jgi:hypothetical protein
MMATRSDVTVRIDQELRRQARDERVNLSRLLEDSLRSEIFRRKTIRDTLAEPQEIRLDLEDKDGRPYIGKFTGRLLGEARGVEVYVTEDQRVIVYDRRKVTHSELEDLAELRDWFPHDPDVYSDAMRALGRVPEIDL